MLEGAREGLRVDLELFRQLVHGQTNKQTDGLTFLVPKVAIATEKTINFGMISPTQT